MASTPTPSAAGRDVTNENHEAFEQFVVCWLFNEVVPRCCRAPGAVDARGGNVEEDPAKPRIRVLELGGGIGAVSTMIQQNLQMVDAEAPHVVVEPNPLLSDGPLLRNRLRHGSRFDVIRGVVSSKAAVPFGLGDIHPDHPRAWMWGTIDASASRKVDVRGAPLSEVEDLLGGAPTILVADCEGGLISLLEDYPQVIDEVVAIYYERDPPGDYSVSEALLAAKGFVPVLIASLHRVVVRESALPRPVPPAAPAVPLSVAEAATLAFLKKRPKRLLSETQTAALAQLEAKVSVATPSPSPSPTPSLATDDAAACRAAVVKRYAAELANLVEEKAARAKELEGLVEETRGHAAKYGCVDKDLEATLLEFVEDHALPALRAARRAKDAVAQASQGTQHVTRRRLAENARVLCGWHDDAWSDDEALEFYTGCATPSDPHDVTNDVYDVVFDDGDGREKVPRAELRSVFVQGGFDWASPFADDADTKGVADEAPVIDGDALDFPLLSSDGAEVLEALCLPPDPPSKGTRVRGRYAAEGASQWFCGTVVGITARRAGTMLLLVRYDSDDHDVDEAWPSADLEVLSEDAVMADAAGPAEVARAAPPAAAAAEPEPAPASTAEIMAIEPEPAPAAVTEPMAIEPSAPPEDADSDDEPIGIVAVPTPSAIGA